MNKLILVLISSLLALSTFNVQAIPITGTLDMGGGAFVLDASGAQTNDASAAVAIDFTPNNFRVLAGDGDFAGLAGQVGSIKDFAFDPFNGSIVDFWQIGVFSFELTGVVLGISNNPSSFLKLDGSGIISAAGFDDTLATWNYSSDTTGNGAFSWSAVSAEDVPEPGMLALLSLGLIVIGLRKGLRKKI